MKTYYDYWNTQQDFSGTSWQLGMSDKWCLRDPSPDALWIEPIIKEYNITSVADVACGTGRLFPLWEKYNLTGVAIEWSDVLYLPMANNAERVGLTPWKSDMTKSRIVTGVELVFCTQFLLHIRPRDIRAVMENLEFYSKYLAICVWYDEDKICKDQEADYDSTHNWSHPYYSLFEEFNLKILKDDTITFSDGSTNKAWLLVKE